VIPSRRQAGIAGLKSLSNKAIQDVLERRSARIMRLFVWWTISKNIHLKHRLAEIHQPIN